jgi:hypothetical protein
MPNDCGAGIDRRFGGPSRTHHQPAAQARRLFCFPEGQDVDADGAAVLRAAGRIASIWARAAASLRGARTNDRTAPSGPMKIEVGRPGGL